LVSLFRLEMEEDDEKEQKKDKNKKEKKGDKDEDESDSDSDSDSDEDENVITTQPDKKKLKIKDKDMFEYGVFHKFDNLELERLMREEDQVTYQITILESQVKEAKPNLESIELYRRKFAETQEKIQELETIARVHREAKEEYEHLRKKRYDEFMEGFLIISSKLKEMYQLITLGGDAELELVDSLDPFSEGISFSVRPPKKSWKQMSKLSGGEKTLSSLSLVFALHIYKPTPLYVMDEIDAALDFKNVSIVGNYIKERTKNAQFIIISLRNNMFELADKLVGIYKVFDETHTVTINPTKMDPTVLKNERDDEDPRGLSLSATQPTLKNQVLLSPAAEMKSKILTPSQNFSYNK